MKMIKIYIMLLIVTDFSMLGAVCSSHNSNVFVEVDTTTNFVVSKEEFKNVNKYLEENGTTWDKTSILNVNESKFHFVINNSGETFTFEYVNSLTGSSTKTITPGGCILIGSNYVDPNAEKIIIKYNGNEMCQVSTSSGSLQVNKNGFPDVEILISRELCDNSDGRCTRSVQENLVGVIIMNKTLVGSMVNRQIYKPKP